MPRPAVWIRSDPAGGLLLGGATVLALALANSGAAGAYEKVRDARFGPGFGHLNLSLGQWSSDGLLALFFFVVGLELTREFVAGDLRDPRRAVVPVAAVGGVVLPVLIYLGVNLASGSPAGGDGGTLRGWAVPAATDIAFTVAVLAVAGRHLPAALRTFLLTLAVVDDLIAITIIAVGYTDRLDWVPLAAAVLAIALFATLFRWKPVWWLLVPCAVATWGLVHASGIHATVAGVLLGISVPVLDPEHVPSARLEHLLQPWSAAVAVPVFAFFAAGVNVGGPGDLAASLRSPVAAGIIAALVVGKSVGITGTTFLVTRLPSIRLDPSPRWPDLAGMALLGGIGFTVSLLVGELAFGATGRHAEEAKVGILAGSLVAAVLGLIVLGFRDRRYGRPGAGG